MIVDKKRKNTLVWALAWAGLLVAVLYSPVGSPGLYVSTNNYVVSSRGGAIAGAKISDVPTLKGNLKSNSGAIGGQDYGAGVGTQNGYSVNGNAFDSRSNSGNLSGFAYGSANNQNAREKTSGIGGGSLMVFTTAKGQNSNNSTIAQNTGVISMSTDMSMFDDYSTNKQSVGAAGDGGTDPGGDPTGPVIPVGDGWIILMVLVSAYTVWKKFKR